MGFWGTAVVPAKQVSPQYTHFQAEVFPPEQAVNVDPWNGKVGQCQMSGNLKGNAEPPGLSPAKGTSASPSLGAYVPKLRE